MPELTLAWSGWSIRETVRPCRWDAPLFAGLAFRPTKNGGWKGRALCFLGHGYLLLSVIILSLCPRALMATMMPRPMFLAATLKLRSFCCTHFHSAHAPFFFFSKLFYTPYVHFGRVSKDCLVSWKQQKKRGGDCGKRRRKQAIFFFPSLDLSVSQTNGDAWAARETCMFGVFWCCARAACVFPWLYPCCITENWNRGNFSAKQPAVWWKRVRSVCPEANVEQQLLITEVQEKESAALTWRPPGAGCSKPAPVHLENRPYQQYWCVCVLVERGPNGHWVMPICLIWIDTAVLLFWHSQCCCGCAHCVQRHYQPQNI